MPLYRVEGRVQGVGFRWFVAQEAHALRVAGWVRNLVDGAVLVRAEGSPEALAALYARVLEGPAGSVVHRVVEIAASDSEAPPAAPFSIL
jgi:acylphosphatase